PNSFSGKLNLNGGTIALDAQDTLLLGSGVLNLNGGTLAPRFNPRTVSVPVNLNADTTVTNNLTIAGVADTSNAGLTFAAPINLGMSGNRTLNNQLGGGILTISSTIYDDPFGTGASITFTGSPSSQTILSGANIYRGGTTINGGTVSISSDANLGASSSGVT